MSPLERDSRFDELARFVSEGIPRRAALRRIGTFVAALAITGPAEALGATKKKKCPKGHALCGTRCCPTGYSCHTVRGKKTCTCSAPKKVCSGTCIDPRSDVRHCGSCSKKCKTGETCVKGKCTPHKSTGQGQQQPGNDTPPADNTPPAPTCTDGVKNGAETDVDCGGGTCPACADGKNCLAGTDCTSGVCTNGVCVAPAATCTDGIKNHGETDVDCGGPNCPGCADGKTCVAGTDCTSGRCVAGTCTAKLADGQPCSAATDCTSGQCSSGTCGAPTLADGQPCSTPSQCTSGHCNDGICRPTTCFDGVKNNSETDVDCGGTCPKCANTKTCNVDTDCISDRCNAGVCAAKIADGQPCSSAHDCASGQCNGGVCGPPAGTCTDGVKNNSETDIDCGGPNCPACANTKACLQNSDCQSNHCSGHVCVAGCSVPGDCGSDTDCLKHTCTGGACGVTFVDFGIATNSQTIGDCKSNICDGAGGVTVATDPGDFPVVGECSIGTCTGGTPGMSQKNPGTTCSGGICDGNGNCVGCFTDNHCPANQWCNVNTCVADLGPGAACTRDAQCSSSSCNAGVCT